MKGWYIYDSNIHDWNKLLNDTKQNLIYNQEFWINLKIQEGWNASQLCYKIDNGEVKMVLVIFTKSYLSFKYIWSPGGLSNCNLDVFEDSLTQLKSFLDNNFGIFYFRMNSVDLFSPYRNYYFNKYFKKPKVLISSGFTIINDTTLGLDQILNNLNSKRRYYLKSALKQNLVWGIGLSKEIIDDLKLVFNNFSKEREIRFKIPANSEIDYLSNFINDFVFIVGYKDGAAVTAAIVNITDEVPLYLYAATTSEGRKISASYSMICQLHDFLCKSGYKHFDLLGISPFEDDIAGIDKFKLTFSGQISKYNGEWEHGTLINRFLGNLIIKLKNL